MYSAESCFQGPWELAQRQPQRGRQGWGAYKDASKTGCCPRSSAKLHMAGGGTEQVAENPTSAPASGLTFPFTKLQLIRLWLAGLTLPLGDLEGSEKAVLFHQRTCWMLGPALSPTEESCGDPDPRTWEGYAHQMPKWLLSSRNKFRLLCSGKWSRWLGWNDW